MELSNGIYYGFDSYNPFVNCAKSIVSVVPEAKLYFTKVDDDFNDIDTDDEMMKENLLRNFVEYGVFYNEIKNYMNENPDEYVIWEISKHYRPIIVWTVFSTNNMEKEAIDILLDASDNNYKNLTTLTRYIINYLIPNDIINDAFCEMHKIYEEDIFYLKDLELFIDNSNKCIETIFRNINKIYSQDVIIQKFEKIYAFIYCRLVKSKLFIRKYVTVNEKHNYGVMPSYNDGAIYVFPNGV